jgi:hypothetical protein
VKGREDAKGTGMKIYQTNRMDQEYGRTEGRRYIFERDKGTVEWG